MSELLHILGRAWAELDPGTAPNTLAHAVWGLASLVGTVLFYGRFYTQLIVSEIRGRSVVPIAFWYMSSVGSLLLLAHAGHIGSPVQTLSQSLNIVIYTRNLVHIWRGHGKLTPALNRGVHVFVALVASAALVLVVYTWMNEYHEIHESKEHVARAWFWIALGVLGTGLFACRFLVQWYATEKHGKSVVPVSFWQISVAAAIMQSASFVQQAEWVYAIGVASNLPVYIRNLFLIRRHGEAEAPAAS